MPRTTIATVRRSALAHNLQRVRELAPTAHIWAVVKANAYGHGLAQAARAFAAADGLALLEWDGALALRAAGERRPILLLEGAFDAAQVDLAIRHQLSLVVHQAAQVEWLERASTSGPIPGALIKINTGMNRLGFRPTEIAAMHGRLVDSQRVTSVGLMTHFADADRADGASAAIRCFNRTVDGISTRKGIECSLANSAAIIDWPATHRDWVRPGVMLYGASPFDSRSATALGLRAAQSLSASLIAIQSLREGDTVGYGSSFTATRAMRIGIVDCGYADGYPRIAPSGTPVAIDGIRSSTIGRVSMDMLAVDLEPVPSAAIGSPVELWGEQVPVDEVAQAAGTIGYELLCAVAPRVQRAWVE